MHDIQTPDGPPAEEMSSTRSARVSVSPTRFVAIKEHLYSDLSGEAVILSLKNGEYYGLNAVGRSIWLSLRSPSSAEEIVALLTSEYEVGEDTCYEEVRLFLSKMRDVGLVEIVDESAA